MVQEEKILRKAKTLNDLRRNGGEAGRKHRVVYLRDYLHRRK